MKTTIVVCSSNRDMEQKTKAALRAMQQAGALYLEQLGTGDAAMARNLALTGACDALRSHAERDVVLMIDDDMVLPLDAVQQVVDAARETAVPSSAVYATQNGRVAGMRYKDGRGAPVILTWEFRNTAPAWLVGLGCLAIPARQLLELERDSESFALHDQQITEFTWACAEAGQWVAEDYRLSRRLGGVRLLPLAVGHVKKIPIWPDQETLDRIRDDAPLASEPDERAREGFR